MASGLLSVQLDSSSSLGELSNGHYHDDTNFGDAVDTAFLALPSFRGVRPSVTSTRSEGLSRAIGLPSLHPQTETERLRATRFTSNILQKSLLARVNRNRCSRRAQTSDALPEWSFHGLSLEQESKNSPNAVSNDDVRCIQFHLPYLSKGANISRPSDLQKKLEGNNGGTKKTVSKVPAASNSVDRAVEMVHRKKKQRREDRLLGVPGDFLTTQPTLHIALDESEKPAGVSTSNVTPAGDSASDPTAKEDESALKDSDTKDTKKKKVQIPATFAFPKLKDFIHRQPTRIETAGVDWTMGKTGSTTDHVKAEETFHDTSSSKKPGVVHRGNTMTMPGKLCRRAYPLSDAMKEEGTSTNVRKGQVLRQGDREVTKVWSRTLLTSGQLPPIPVQMAKEDISLKMLRSAQRRKKANTQAALESSSVDVNDEISRGFSDELSSSLDTRNDMYMTTEEEEEE